MEWAGRSLAAAPAKDWQSALSAEDGGPLLELGIRLAGSDRAPPEPQGLKDAIHEHFQGIADGEPVWQPDPAAFFGLTRLLRAAARRVLASQLCAELEGRGGQVPPALFATYGSFLAGEQAFR